MVLPHVLKTARMERIDETAMAVVNRRDRIGKIRERERVFRRRSGQFVVVEILSGRNAIDVLERVIPFRK
jgi:hypothetical protein